MMSPDDARHGTTRGYQAHRRDEEPPCAPCVAAKTRYEKARHVYGPRSIPAIGTRRRIHALMALGHSGADIATYLNISYQAVHRLEHTTADRVWRTTAERVAAVYDELSMIRPTGHYATRVRRKAAARGYAPPLAWDDIDLDREPRGVRTAERRDLLTEWAELQEAGESIEQAARRFAVTVGAIEKARERAQKQGAA